MTVLFALVPSLIALVIFVGTFRLGPTRTAEPRAPQAPAVITQRTKALRTPIPVGAVRRTSSVPGQLRA